MKPQSLQDAIKAQALRREKARQSGGWKEPVVKEHKVTAEDLVKSPTRRLQSPIAAPPIYASSNVPPVNNTELLSIKKMLEEMKDELKSQRNDISLLRKENKELRNAIEALCTDRDEKENKVKAPALLEPNSANEIADGQRIDKDLRLFMKTKEGLYDTKYLSFRDENGSNIVCFKKKIYIPESLRAKTIKYYKRQHSNDREALAAIRKNCIWPDLEKDFYDPSKI